MNVSEYRIGLGVMLALMSVAILFDIIGLIAVLLGIGLITNSILAILFALYSGFIFLLRGVPVLSFRRIKTWLISTIGEMIPLINTLPMLSVGTAYIIYITRHEDRAKARESAADESSFQRPIPPPDIKMRNQLYNKAA